MGMKFRKVSIEDALKGAKQNDLKFSPERNGKYNVYFPSVETVTMAKIHEWRDGGKYQSAACSGEDDCPFCAVEKAGWEDYRAKIDEAIAGLDPTTDKDKIHERKMALVPRITSQDKVYMLVAIVTPADAKAGTKESYTLKVLTPSNQRLENFKSYAEETSEAGSLLGATLLLKYPDEENARDRGKNMQILPGKPVSEEIKAAIDEEAKNFNWEAALSGFYEFRTLSADDIAKAIKSAGYEAVESDDDEEEVPFAEEAPASKKSDDDGGNGGAGGAADDADDAGDDGADDLDDLV